MTKYKLIKIVTMWDKINELSRQSLSQMQIALQLGIDDIMLMPMKKEDRK